LPLADPGLLLFAFFATLLLPTAKKDRALVAFSVLFFVAGSIRGVSLGMPLPVGGSATGRETVRFLGIVAKIKQSGPLVGFVVKEGRVEKVYGGNELRYIPKFVVYTFGNSGRYEGREGNRIIGLGRIQKYSLTGERPIYAAGALLSGFAYKIDAEREKIIFFGKKREKGIRGRLADNIIGALRGDRKYAMGRDFIVTILTGKRGYRSECREVLIDSGLAHLLAISGLHVGVAFLFFGFASRFFFLIFNRLGFVFDMNTPSLALGAVAAMAYAFLAGMPVTVSRAYSMMIFSALAVRKCDDGSVFTPLAFAFFVVILQEPAAAFTVSFVYSFAITFYLLLLLGGFPSGKKGKVKIGLSISLTAYCASIPLSAYFFNHVALFGFLYNFFFVPLFIPLIGVAIVWVFLCIINVPLVKLAGGGLVMLSDTLIRCLRWLVGYTGHASKVTMPNMTSLLFYFLAFTFIFLLSKKKDKNADTLM
jgi:ComEC/Rec2-related protein